MNRRVTTSAVGAAALLALAGCAAAPPPDPNAMAIDVRFALNNLCGLGVSPAIVVTNPPAATAKYAITMRNIDVLLPSPWEATVTATGATIPEGAGPDYRGPCPGEFQRHRYRFTVTALDANGRALAQAQVTHLAVATSAFVQRNNDGIAQPPLADITAVGRVRGGGGPNPTLDIGPLQGVAGWRTPSFYRESDDPVFGPAPSAPSY